jgi:hypothetical protein
VRRRRVLEVSVIREGKRLVVECRDPSKELPRVVAVPNSLRECGRGMCLVVALAYDYGVDLGDGDGKTVWYGLVAWPGSDAEVAGAIA